MIIILCGDGSWIGPDGSGAEVVHADADKPETLVKALTGVDADRLKEEKARGITIDLGYAYSDLGDGRQLGFVDVPGHERFVHTMVAGATGIDVALLVVAADDGVMPQTEEHLQIVRHLGVQRAVFVVTKVDLVSAERVRAVEDEIAIMEQEVADAIRSTLPVRVPGFIREIVAAGFNLMDSRPLGETQYILDLLHICIFLEIVLNVFFTVKTGKCSA